jgi:hypothetical protein
VSKIDVGNDSRLKGKLIDAETQHAARRIERGAMGWLLGLGDEKPGNVAGFAILIACLMIIALGLINFGPDVPRRELIMLIAGIIPGSLGYYFGFLTGKKQQD